MLTKKFPSAAPNHDSKRTIDTKSKKKREREKDGTKLNDRMEIEKEVAR